VKSKAPGSIFSSYIFGSTLLFAFFFYLHLLFLDLYYQKPQNMLLHFILFHVLSRSIYAIYHNFYPYNLAISGTVPERIDNPLTRRVASICPLCADTVYIVLLGSPTGSITSVSSLREIPTEAVLHHCFLFGEIPT